MKINSGNIYDVNKGSPYQFKKTYLMKPTKKIIRHLDPSMSAALADKNYKMESNKKLEEIDLKDDF